MGPENLGLSLLYLSIASLCPIILKLELAVRHKEMLFWFSGQNQGTTR